LAKFLFAFRLAKYISLFRRSIPFKFCLFSLVEPIDFPVDDFYTFLQMLLAFLPHSGAREKVSLFSRLFDKTPVLLLENKQLTVFSFLLAV